MYVHTCVPISRPLAYFTYMITFRQAEHNQAANQRLTARLVCRVGASVWRDLFFCSASNVQWIEGGRNDVRCRARNEVLVVEDKEGRVPRRLTQSAT